MRTTTTRPPTPRIRAGGTVARRHPAISRAGLVAVAAGWKQMRAASAHGTIARVVTGAGPGTTFARRTRGLTRLLPDAVIPVSHVIVATAYRGGVRIAKQPARLANSARVGTGRFATHRRRRAVRVAVTRHDGSSVRATVGATALTQASHAAGGGARVGARGSAGTRDVHREYRDIAALAAEEPGARDEHGAAQAALHWTGSMGAASGSSAGPPKETHRPSSPTGRTRAGSKNTCLPCPESMT